MTLPSPEEFVCRDVRLTDLYKDEDGGLWRVVGIATDPTVTVENVISGKREHHVIGSLNWRTRFKTKYRPDPT